MTTEDLLSKIILDTATAEDFAVLDYDFDKSIEFFTMKSTEDILSALGGLTVVTGVKFMTIRQIHPPFNTFYSIMIGSGYYTIHKRDKTIYKSKYSIDNHR